MKKLSITLGEASYTLHYKWENGAAKPYSLFDANKQDVIKEVDKALLDERVGTITETDGEVISENSTEEPVAESTAKNEG